MKKLFLACTSGNKDRPNAIENQPRGSQIHVDAKTNSTKEVSISNETVLNQNESQVKRNLLARKNKKNKKNKIKTDIEFAELHNMAEKVNYDQAKDSSYHLTTGGRTKGQVDVTSSALTGDCPDAPCRGVLSEIVRNDNSSPIPDYDTSDDDLLSETHDVKSQPYKEKPTKNKEGQPVAKRLNKDNRPVPKTMHPLPDDKNDTDDLNRILCNKPETKHSPSKHHGDRRGPGIHNSTRTTEPGYANADAKPSYRETDRGMSNRGDVTKSNKKIIISFDVGGTMSGFAYSTSSEKSNIHINRTWKSQHQISTTKTPTLILRKKETHLFGYDAFITYERAPNPREFCLFTKYKSQLHNKKEELYTIDSDAGFKGKAKIHMRKFMQIAFESLSKNLIEQVPDTRQQETLWVITHRFDLSDHGQKLIKEIATMVKEGDDPDDDTVVLISEDKAAALWCQQIPLSLDDDEKQHSTMPPGDNFCIVDCGGESITVSGHGPKMNSKPFVIEFDLDEKIEELFNDVFPLHNNKDSYGSQFCRDWFYMLNQVKTYSYGFKYLLVSDCHINLPYTFVEYLKKQKVHKLNKYLEKYVGRHKSHVFYSNDSFVIRHEYFFSIFDKIANDLGKRVDDWAVDQIDNAFIIGGSSSFLADPIWQTLQKLPKFKNCLLSEPHDPTVCVMKGGVLYGKEKC